MPSVNIEGFKCTRCSHIWVSRGINKPIQCPSCKNPYWDKERKYKNE